MKKARQEDPEQKIAGIIWKIRDRISVKCEKLGFGSLLFCADFVVSVAVHTHPVWVFYTSYFIYSIYTSEYVCVC